MTSEVIDPTLQGASLFESLLALPLSSPALRIVGSTRMNLAAVGDNGQPVAISSRR